MSLYPVFLDLRNRPVLVVGGGPVAERKSAALLHADARIRIVARSLTPQLRQWVEQGRIAFCGTRFQPSRLDDVWLVIAATGQRDRNAAIAEQASLRRIPINVVDDPALCTFQVPAVLDRSPLVIAISTGGTAPALARRVREHLEGWLDHSLGALVELAGRYRGRIRSAHPDPGRRRRFYDWLHDGPVSSLLRRRQPERAAAALLDALRRDAHASTGSVSLVGAGPGDPGLLTLKGLRALHEADVIVYDRLVEPTIVAMGRRDAVRIDVGKRPGEEHAATQSRIHDLLIRHARAGSRVVRLKGGDPFVFGRGGEELQALRAHGVDYEVVPGITAANACAAYAGVPLTHRDHAQSVHLVTAHCSASLDTLDWHALARERQTLAVYMGVSELPALTRRLLQHGRAADTPFALVENGTRANQRVLTGALSQLPERAAQHGIRAPALLILGKVSALATQLGWFGQCIGDRPAHAAA